MISRDEANERGLGGPRGCCLVTMIAIIGTVIALAVIVGVSLVV